MPGRKRIRNEANASEERPPEIRPPGASAPSESEPNPPADAKRASGTDRDSSRKFFAALPADSAAVLAILLDTNDAVIAHDFEGKIIAWNRGAEQLMGYTEAEALQMNCARVIPEEEHDKVHPYWEQLRRGEHVNSWESQRRTKDGRLLHVYVTAAALRDASGRAIAIVKTERDITEQTLAHARLEKEIQQRTTALRVSQEQLAAILHTAADSIITIDARGIIQSVNTATERMFGYRAAEMVGRNVRMLMPSPYREEHDRYLENFHRTGIKKIIGIGREVVGQRKDGSTMPIELAVSEVDHLKLFTGILRDITPRKQAEQALRESERFARSTFDGLSAQIAIVDQTGTILAVNQAWREFAPSKDAGSESVAEGANYLRVCENSGPSASEEGPIVAAGIRGVLDKSVPQFVFEYPCHDREGERWFQVRVTPFPGDDPRRAVVAHEEITRRKQLEREVLEIASREQRRIGQDLHDSVGQELTALNLLAADLAETPRIDSANARKMVARIVQGLQRCQRELRAVMRGLLPVAVDSEGLMAALSDLADRIQQDGKANCTFDCPEPIAVADNLTATQLYLIAQEAVHNAVKHARPKNIRISLKSAGPLELVVQDDGIGIPAPSTEDRGRLGLRIMHHRAAILGATLTIQPAQPTGTRVACTLMKVMG